MANDGGKKVTRIVKKTYTSQVILWSKQYGSTHDSTFMSSLWWFDPCRVADCLWVEPNHRDYYWGTNVARWAENIE